MLIRNGRILQITIWLLFLFGLLSLRAEDRLLLPKPSKGGRLSLEELIHRRTSTRSYADRPIRLDQISQLLWAAGGMNIDGISGASRSAPSAGGIYPLEFYIVVGDVEGLPPGIYRYEWTEHALQRIKTGDHRAQLAFVALNQRFIQTAPAVFIITADFKKTARKYGQRGILRYVPMDAGHAAQNIFLQGIALGLGLVTVGAFFDDGVKELLGVYAQEPLYILPVGWPRS